MKLYPTSTDAEIIAELGRRHKGMRIAAGMTQAEQAERAGVTRSTVQRFERGATIQLDSLIKLLRTLDRVDALELVFPEELRSPLEEREDRDRPRQRVRHRTVGRHPGGVWHWGDSSEDSK